MDIAKLKAEFLYHYHRAHGTPWRSRLFGHVAALNRVTAWLAPLSTRGMRLSLTQWVLDRFLRIDRRRPLPRVVNPTFEEWFRSRRQPPGTGEQKSVAFFYDTFTNYHLPQVGMAVVRVLEAVGYQVVLPPKRCCGRPMVSEGLLEQARAYARWNVDALYPYVEQGIRVVGCEPSCLLTLRDEYPDLLPGDARARSVADNALLLEEFLLELHEQEKLDSPFKAMERRLLFYGHCHQKALVGNGPSLDALRLVPGLEVEEIDSGCCGMAGAFGYEKEHYDLSMAIGRQRLFPAVEAAPEAEVVANGFSCRQQIEDGTGRRPRHLAEVLAEALA